MEKRKASHPQKPHATSQPSRFLHTPGLSIPKGAFVRWAMQLLSVTVQRGNADMYRRSGLVISREPGLRYDAGFAVPVLMS